jgi:hypothetical protein
MMVGEHCGGHVHRWQVGLSCFVVVVWLCGSHSWCHQQVLIMSGKACLSPMSFQSVFGDEGPCLVAGCFYSLSGISISSSWLQSLRTSFCLDSVPSSFWCSAAGSD